jgi:pyruvate dehydrogenase E2 component (dihydrolipoamide acetyltransferase)
MASASDPPTAAFQALGVSAVPIEVNMAKISPTMESGQIVKWLVKVGDKVKEGDTLAEVQTDKAVMPMEAFDEGVVARLDVSEGDEVPVGKRVMVLAKKGEDAKAVAESSGGAAAKAAPAVATGAPAARAESTTVSRQDARAAEGNGQSRETGHAPAPAPAISAGVAVGDGGRVKSSPLARKIAAAENVDLREVTPSGPDGRVIRRDVEEFLQHRTEEPSTATAARRPASSGQTAPTRIPLSRMRTTIAQRMAESKRTAPDIHLTADIRLDHVVSIREQLNQRLAAEKIKLSIGDFVTRAVAMSLKRHPGLNATFEDNSIIQYPEVNLGLAVAVEGGLIVPVLRNADLLGLREIRLGSEALYQAARQMKLTADQMNGATFTISNLGMYGIRQFDAILNLPQVGILAVGAADKRPVVVGDSLGIGTVMTITLTADHRAVDGAAAAEFVRTLRGLLEEPASMLL